MLRLTVGDEVSN